MTLTPRELNEKLENTDDLAVKEMTGHDYCLNCGDCVEVCHIQARTNEKGITPLRFGWNNKGRSCKGEKIELKLVEKEIRKVI